MGLISYSYSKTITATVTMDGPAVKNAGLDTSNTFSIPKGAGCKWRFESVDGSNTIWLQNGMTNPDTRVVYDTDSNGNEIAILTSVVKVNCSNKTDCVAYFGASDGAMPCYAYKTFTPDETKITGSEDEKNIIVEGLKMPYVRADGDEYKGIQMVIMMDNTASMKKAIAKAKEFLSDILGKYLSLSVGTIEYCILGYHQDKNRSHTYHTKAPTNDTSQVLEFITSDNNRNILNCFSGQKINPTKSEWNNESRKGILFPGNVKSYKTGNPYPCEFGFLPMVEPEYLNNDTNFYQLGVNEPDPKKSLIGKYWNAQYPCYDKNGNPFYIFALHPNATSEKGKNFKSGSNKTQWNYKSRYSWTEYNSEGNKIDPAPSGHCLNKKSTMATCHCYPSGLGKNTNPKTGEMIDDFKKSGTTGKLLVGKTADCTVQYITEFGLGGTSRNNYENALGCIWEACVGLEWDPTKLHVIINLGDEPGREYGFASRYYVLKDPNGGDVASNRAPKRVSLIETVEMMNERAINLLYISTGSVWNDKNYWTGKALEYLSNSTSKCFSMTDDEIDNIVNYLTDVTTEIKQVEWLPEVIEGGDPHNIVDHLSILDISANEHIEGWTQLKPNKEYMVCINPKSGFKERLGVGTYDVHVWVHNKAGVGIDGMENSLDENKRHIIFRITIKNENGNLVV